MSVKETDVFVHRPLDRFERYSYIAGYKPKRLTAGEDEALLFDGADVKTATCGLLAIGKDRQWVQVLHTSPEDVDALAKFLVMIGVGPEELDVMQDWDGNPLFDIEKLINAIKAANQSGRVSAAYDQNLKSGMES